MSVGSAARSEPSPAEAGPAAPPPAAGHLARTLADRVAGRAAGLATVTLPSPTLAPLRRRLDAEETATLDRLRHGWHARLDPLDEPERAATDTIVALVWRQGALAAVEERLCRDLVDGPASEALRALALLCRYRRCLAKERAAAERDYHELTRLRPPPPAAGALNPERLEWLAARMRREREHAEAVPPRPVSSPRPAPAPHPAPRHAAPEPPASAVPRPAETPRPQPWHAPPEAGERPDCGPSLDRAGAPPVAPGLRARLLAGTALPGRASATDPAAGQSGWRGGAICSDSPPSTGRQWPVT